MDTYEATKIVLSRIQSLDPENASRITGYILIQDQGEKEMIRLAFSPESLLLSYVNQAKACLGLPSNSCSTPSTPSSPSPFNNNPISNPGSRSNPFSQTSPRIIIPNNNRFHLNNPSSPSSPWSSRSSRSASYAAVVNGSTNTASGSSSSSLSLPFFNNNSSDLSDELGNIQVQDQLSFLDDSLDPIVSPSGRSDSLLFPYGNCEENTAQHHHLQLHRRSCSVNDVFLGCEDVAGGGNSGFGWRPCLYFARGFCKNGTTCKFLHSGGGGGFGAADTSPDVTGPMVGSPSKIDGFDELIRLKAIQQQRFAAAQQLMASGAPPFAYNKCMNFLNDNPRSAAATLMMGDEFHKFGRCRPERSEFSAMGLGGNASSASRQIYLTFPADSTFKEEDVSNYFSAYGPVQDVRIPYQQKRMFGFVTFVYPETVKLILAKGNPHFVCDSRVLVKPYKEKGKVPEKKQHQQQQQHLERGEFSGCLSPSGMDSREPFDQHTVDQDGEDMEDIEELIALDEEADLQKSPDGIPLQGLDKPSGAKVLSKAQRIVVELNTDNAKRVVDENEYVMVLGYAPWCTRSAELMPRFAEAANVLKELGSPLLMSKIDGERYPKAASTLGIKGFPTLLLFVNGTSQPYSGGFTSEEIVIWARKKTGLPIIRVSSVIEANEYQKKHNRFVVGLFSKFEGREYEEFVKAATSENEIQFLETNSLEVAKVLFPDAKETEPFLGLTKSEPERYTVYDGTLTTEGILQFLDDYKFPLVTLLTELNSVKVYSITQKTQVFVLSEADDLKNLTVPLQDVARKFKSKIMLVLVDIKEDNLAKPFLSLFGLEESDDTVVIAFDYKSNSKYLLESDPTPAKIEEFCLGLCEGKLLPFYKSQPIPDNKEANILTVVGKTFDDLVLGSPRNVLLEVHTPWCISCDTTSKKVEKLAKHFKGLENLVFARIDASANEHPNLQVEEYPALVFYTAKDKEHPIKFSTKSSSKDLAALINKSLKEQDEVTKDEL